MLGNQYGCGVTSSLAEHLADIYRDALFGLELSRTTRPGEHAVTRRRYGQRRRIAVASLEFR